MKNMYVSYLYNEPEGVAEGTAGEEQCAQEHVVVVMDRGGRAGRLQVRFQNVGRP